MWKKMTCGGEKSLVSQQEVVDYCDVDTGDLAVAVDVAGGEIGGVAIEQIVVEGGDVDRCYLAVAVHIAHDAWKRCERSLEAYLIEVGEVVVDSHLVDFGLIEFA